MKDTLIKLRALVSMKTTLLTALQNDLDHARFTVEALRGDLEHAVNLIKARDREIMLLKYELATANEPWWLQQDKDEEWLHEYLATESTYERSQFNELDEDTIEARDNYLEETDGLVKAIHFDNEPVNEHGDIISSRKTLAELMNEDEDEDEDIPF